MNSVVQYANHGPEESPEITPIQHNEWAESYIFSAEAAKDLEKELLFSEGEFHAD